MAKRRKRTLRRRRNVGKRKHRSRRLKALYKRQRKTSRELQSAWDKQGRGPWTPIKFYDPRKYRRNSGSVRAHGESGHVNVLLRDQESDITGFGKHNRILVFGDLNERTVIAREDIRWGLPMSNEKQRRKILTGWQRMHPRGSRLVFEKSVRYALPSGKESIEHVYNIVRAKRR